MSNKQPENNACHITSIGGQSVMEGVMMRGPKEIATAVRKSNGEIIIDKKPVNSFVSKHKFFKFPIIRGVVSFIDSMITGTKCLMFSAEQYDIEDGEAYEPSKFEKWLEDKWGDKIKDIAIYFAVVVAIFFSVGLFFVIPNILVGFVRKLITANIVLNLVEGAVRITIFLVYLALVSRMKDIQRVFEYHGAEHKTIATYEAGEELTTENAKKHSRLHPRCGTSFLLIVMVVSIIFFSFLKWENPIERIVFRLLLLPIVAGVSYEIIKFAGRSKSKTVKILTMPGLWLQKLTTREPDESQLEVAIASLKAVLTDNKEDDKW